MTGQEPNIATQTAKPRWRSIAKWLGGGLAVLVALAVVAAAFAPRVVTGPRFGGFVERALPEVRGKVHVGGGAWSWGALIALWRGRPADVVLEDVRVTDPEGLLVLRIGRATATVELRRTPLSVAIRNLTVADAEWVFATMARERKVGFLAAFESVARPGRPRARAATSAEIRIEGARLEHVSVKFALSTWGLVLKDVRGDAGLWARAGGGEKSKFGFDVRDADVAGGGLLRILSGADAFELPFSRARIERVATLDDAPDDIQIRATGVVTGRSAMQLAGAFFGVYGVSPASRDPGLRLTAAFTDAADAVAALARSRGIRWLPGVGEGATFRLGFDGPFNRLALEGGLASRKLGNLATRLTLAGSRLDAAVDFERFALGPLLPLPLVPFAAGTLDGHLRGHLDAAAGAVAIDEADVTLTRPEDMGAPRRLRARVGTVAQPRRGPAADFALDLAGARYRAGRVELPRVSFPIYGGRMAAGGSVALRDPNEGRWLSPPAVDLALRAERLPIDRITGVGFVSGDVRVRARVTGPLDALAVRLELPGRQALTVLGERFGLPARAALHIGSDGVRFERVHLTGPKSSALEAAGRILLPDRLALSIAVRGFPVDRLPGLAETGLPIAGQISGEVDISGDADAPALAGKLVLDPVTFQGRPVGGGALTISPGPKGAIRARGRLVEGIEADGTLAPGRKGLEGEATIKLVALRLDPLLPPLPGGVAMAGVVSGRIVARVAPGRPASVDGRLDQLRLIATPPARGAEARQPLAIEAESGIPFSAESGLGPIAIGPARFRGNVGAFELAGESRGADARAKLRGRIELGALAAVIPPAVDRLAGAVSVDLAARTDLSAGVVVEGEVAVAAPVSLRVPAVPFDANIPSGRVRLRNGTIETTALPVRVRADRVADVVRRLQAEVRVDARLANLPDAPTGSARIAIDRASAEVPALGPQPIRSERGEVIATVRAGQPQLARVDLPLSGEIRGIAAGGANIDRATFGLRLRGEPRRLTLSGDVQLGAARASAKSLSAAKAGRAGGGGSKPLAPARGRPEIENMALDLRVRSSSGAVAVDVPNLPDLRVDVDLHVGGTVRKPAVTGDARGANVWSSMALWLRKVFD